MKEILITQGGGRPNGNAAQLPGTFTHGAEETGHYVKIASLLKAEVEGGLGYNTCRYGKSCTLKDGSNGFDSNNKAADLIVFTSSLKLR